MSGFPGESVVKNPPANAGDSVSIPGSRRSPGEEIATYSSILAWEIPCTDEPGKLHSMWSQRVRHDFSSFSSVTQSCPILYNAMDCSMLGLPVYHQLPKFTQTLVHQVSDAIQPSHPLSSPSPPTLNFSQHQGRFQQISSLHQVPKVLELQLQHQSFQ